MNWYCKRRVALALIGLGPVDHAYNLWVGIEPPPYSPLATSAFYTLIRAESVVMLSIPSALIQAYTLLCLTSCAEVEGQPASASPCSINVLSLATSCIGGSIIITQENFDFIPKKYVSAFKDPYYSWPSEKRTPRRLKQMLGMVLFNVCYFSQYAFAMCLATLVFGFPRVFNLLCLEFGTVCVYLGYKRELLGTSLQIINASNKLIPFPFYLHFYFLTSSLPMLMAGAPMELGPEAFTSLIVWRILTNGVLTVSCLPSLGYLDLPTGLSLYALSMCGLVAGLVTFMMNCRDGFDTSLFWKPRRGKDHLKTIWVSDDIWAKDCATKDEERRSILEVVHPIYLPFDELRDWICVDLVRKYADPMVERPQWLETSKKESFIGRLVEVYEWKKHEPDINAINEALGNIFAGGKKTYLANSNVKEMKEMKKMKKKSIKTARRSRGGTGPLSLWPQSPGIF